MWQYPDGKKLKAAVRETDISRQNGGTFEGPPPLKSLNSTVMFERFQDEPPHDAERRDSLGQLYV